MTNYSEILKAKMAAGADAYLWIHSSGDCILWADEADSIGDDGSRALARWQVDAATIDALIASGNVDDVA